MYKTIKCAAPSAKVIFCLVVVFAAFTFSAISTSATVSGAIQTTNSTGTEVNGNIYDSKTDVYLTGGPQNSNGKGLVPDGFYYFQVTDPSGAVLLSTDSITCREVVVLNGNIIGVPSDNGTPPSGTVSGCDHQLGTFNNSNGEEPVQLAPFNDTPNPGGEYKAWIIPVGNYDAVTCASNFGFCDSASKTDNFKVRKPGVGYVTVCKFNDQDGNGIQSVLEPLIPHWPITATGVDMGNSTNQTVMTQTDDGGCVSFAVSGISTDGVQQVTLSEGTQGPDWTQTAPANGQCTLTGTVNPADTCNVSGGSSSTLPSAGGMITVTVSQDDNVSAPYFGNTNPNCGTGCSGNQVIVTKDANPIVTYTWTIKKSVDKTEIDTAPGGNTTFNYTVTATPDSGTATMKGTIRVSNATGSDITGVVVSDAVSDVAAPDGGACTVAAGDFQGTPGGTVLAGDHADVGYTCTFTNMPPKGSNTNTATASWDSSSAIGTANFDFSAATIVDGSVTVTDPLMSTTTNSNGTDANGTLGIVSVDLLGTVTTTPTSPVTSSGAGIFNYSYTVNGTAGTCVTVNNTATFTTNTTSTTGTAGKSVTVCEGADLTVVKTATPTFTRTYNWKIVKSVDKTRVEQSGGSVKFTYTVVASETAPGDSGWTVAGTITVSNPNDWEAISPTVTESLDGGSNCTYTDTAGNPVTFTSGSSVMIAKSSSYSVKYSCTLGSGTGGTNTATAAWTAATYYTTDSSAQGQKAYSFTTPTPVNKTITPTDAFNGGTAVNLCTLALPTVTPCTLTATDTTPYTTQTYTYSRTITNSSAGTCTSYTNTAVTGLTGLTPASLQLLQSSSQTVTVCNTNTGALTMGFWKNSNGAKIITSGPKTGTCPVATFLRTFNPYQDLSSTATCSAVATYVATVIGGANCSTGGFCNTMLRAQMLATALDVFYSDPANGDPIKAYNGNVTVSLGGVAIDLSKICAMTDGSSSSSCTGTNGDARLEFGICSGLNTPVTGVGCTVATAGLGTTVSKLLSYANHLSTINGSPVATPSTGASWYLQVKTKQVPAKDVFDNINNTIANITTSIVNPSF